MPPMGGSAVGSRGVNVRMRCEMTIRFNPLLALVFLVMALVALIVLGPIVLVWEVVVAWMEEKR
jgi:hypothetical protein